MNPRFTDFSLYLVLQIKLCISELQSTICKLQLQPEICMTNFPVRTAEQLPALLQGFRKQAGLTQAATALRLGVTQQTLSAMERNADKISADRLLQVLNIFGVELILRQAGDPPSQNSSGPLW
ncbi:helix-turn-helix domain-containing protein [Pollutimonas nitritireducens]|uniref:helix-turn-helix domain-containing protein n=1 Tax=Pollutimonas nitritireducens TaxID=2045209 RepID=UPI003F6F31BE